MNETQRSENPGNPTMRIYNGNHRVCNCVDSCNADLFGEQDIKYPDEVQKDDLIRQLARLERELERKTDDLAKLRKTLKAT